MNHKGVIEAILFVAGEAVEYTELSRVLSITEIELNSLLNEMEQEYIQQGCGILLYRINDKVQLKTNEAYAEQINEMFQPQQKYNLSQSVLETVSIIAYRQPITKAEIEMIRGVKCDHSVSVLMDKRLICVVGKKDTLGRPNLYGTTEEFLRHFGIPAVEALPSLEKLIEEEAQSVEGQAQNQMGEQIEEKQEELADIDNENPTELNAEALPN